MAGEGVTLEFDAYLVTAPHLGGVEALFGYDESLDMEEFVHRLKKQGLDMSDECLGSIFWELLSRTERDGDTTNLGGADVHRLSPDACAQVTN